MLQILNFLLLLFLSSHLLGLINLNVCIPTSLFLSLSLPHGIYQIYKYIFCVCNMPNLDPWVNQNNNDYEDTATKTVSKFENHLLSIKMERQKMIHPNSHPTYNERQQKIIEMIDWTLEKYKAGANIKMTNQQNEQQEVIIDSIVKELDKKREVDISKKQKTLLKDEVLEYGEEEDTIDYILYIIGQLRSNSF
jgi:hypothetical protein